MKFRVKIVQYCVANGEKRTVSMATSTHFCIDVGRLSKTDSAFFMVNGDTALP